MKVKHIDIDERYYLRKKQEIYDSFKVEAEQVIKDREMMAGCRAQWMLLVALVRKGYGKKRLRAVLDEIQTFLESLIEDREAEVMDEMLIMDLERIGLNIRDTHREYWEAKARLENFGKYIDKKKERAEAEAKEKELLRKLNINIMNGKEKFI